MTTKPLEKTLSIINPSTEEVITELPSWTPEDLEMAVSRAKEAMNGPWSKMPARERGRILLKISQEIRNRQEKLARLETQNTGKPINDSMDEVQLAADTFEYYAGAANKFFGETIPVTGRGLCVTLKEPIGVCALVVPWNYPLVIACWKVAPALACGNTVLLKPASLTPLTALELGRIALEAGLPEGVLQIVVGPGSTIGQQLITHPDVAKISLTGETSTGKEVMRTAADSLKRVSLELGGKSPNIVFDDVDVKACVAGSIFSVFSNCGQDCCARSRFIVSEKIYDKFVAELTAKAKTLKIGDPLSQETQIGPMISHAQRQRVLDYVDAGKQEKAELIWGGTVPSKSNGVSKGYFIIPAIFAKAAPRMRIVREEIFGPVVCVLPFKDEEEAITLANDSIYGLSGSIWTNNSGRAIRVAKRVKSGVLSVNSSQSVHLEAPFGGYKQSGLGRELGMKALETYSETKTVFFSET